MYGAHLRIAYTKGKEEKIKAIHVTQRRTLQLLTVFALVKRSYPPIITVLSFFLFRLLADRHLHRLLLHRNKRDGLEILNTAYRIVSVRVPITSCEKLTYSKN